MKKLFVIFLSLYIFTLCSEETGTNHTQKTTSSKVDREPPELTAVSALPGGQALILRFSEPVFSAESGSEFSLADFTYVDVNAGGAREILSLIDADGSDGIVVLAVTPFLSASDFGSGGDILVIADGYVVDGSGNGILETTVPLQLLAQTSSQIDPSFVLSGVKTLDLDLNCRIDHLRLAFTQSVDDSSFPGYVAAGSTGTPTEFWKVDGYCHDDEQRCRIDNAVAGDTTDDNTLYLKLPEGPACDTGARPALFTSASPGLKNHEGYLMGPVSTADVLTSDGAAALLVETTSSEGSSTIQLAFSESVFSDPGPPPNGTFSASPVTYNNYDLTGATTLVGVSDGQGDDGSTAINYLSVEADQGLGLSDRLQDTISLQNDTVFDQAGNSALTVYGLNSLSLLGSEELTDYLQILTAFTLDENADGKLDHLKVIFNLPIDDASFPGYIENSAGMSQSVFELEEFTNLRMVHGTAAPEADTPGDNVIYLAFSPNNRVCGWQSGPVFNWSGCDTDHVPRLTINAGGLPKSQGGLAYQPAYQSQYNILDGAPPAVVFHQVIEADSYEGARLRIWFSERVYSQPEKSLPASLANFSYTDGGGGGLHLGQVEALQGPFQQGRLIELPFKQIDADPQNNQFYTYLDPDDQGDNLNIDSLYDSKGNLLQGVIPLNVQNIINSISIRPYVVAEATTNNNYTCIRTFRGKAKCWGLNYYGQLGIGNTNDVSSTQTPEFIPFVKIGFKAKQVAAGNINCALSESGQVKCWGGNGNYGLGYLDVIGDNEQVFEGSFSPVGFTVKQISIGDYSCVLGLSGQVKCWGQNAYGQLGAGHTDTIGDNETISSISNVNTGTSPVFIATGSTHTCILYGQNIKCWGFGGGGRLGYGNTDWIGDDETPASVSLVNSILQSELSVGSAHSCSIKSGIVTCWGKNTDGQLGRASMITIGDDEDPFNGGYVRLHIEAEKVYAYNHHTCTVSIIGDLACWGYNSKGQLGYGHTLNIGDDEHPAVAGLVDVGMKVSSLSTGLSEHTCAIGINNQLRCWGNNQYGQLGYGHTDRIGDDETPASAGDVPVLPPNYFNPKTMNFKVANSHYCWQDTNGRLYCSGSNYNGQTGYPEFVKHDSWNSPAVELGSRQIVDYDLENGITCVLDAMGDVLCWGRNDDGHLGQGHAQTIGDDEIPAAGSIVGLPAAGISDPNDPGKAKAMATGSSSVCAILKNDTVYCWGNNDEGRLGYGTADHVGDNELPSGYAQPPLDFERELYDIEVRAHSCVISAAGEVFCWGPNDTGQLGLGHTDTIGDDERAMASNTALNLPGRVIKLEMGRSHTCALTADYKAYCWGDNTYGQLGLSHTDTIGDDETADQFMPVDTGGLRVMDIAAGFDHTCVIVDERNFNLPANVLCFGINGSGQLGYGPIPTEYLGDDESITQYGYVPTGYSINGVPQPRRAISLTADVNTTCALLEDDRWTCWGNNVSCVGMCYRDGTQPDMIGLTDRPLDWPPKEL